MICEHPELYRCDHVPGPIFLCRPVLDQAQHGYCPITRSVQISKALLLKWHQAVV